MSRSTMKHVCSIACLPSTATSFAAKSSWQMGGEEWREKRRAYNKIDYRWKLLIFDQKPKWNQPIDNARCAAARSIAAIALLWHMVFNKWIDFKTRSQTMDRKVFRGHFPVSFHTVSNWFGFQWNQSAGNWNTHRSSFEWKNMHIENSFDWN